MEETNLTRAQDAIIEPEIVDGCIGSEVAAEARSAKPASPKKKRSLVSSEASHVGELVLQSSVEIDPRFRSVIGGGKVIPSVNCELGLGGYPAL